MYGTGILQHLATGIYLFSTHSGEARGGFLPFSSSQWPPIPTLRLVCLHCLLSLSINLKNFHSNFQRLKHYC